MNKTKALHGQSIFPGAKHAPRLPGRRAVLPLCRPLLLLTLLLTGATHGEADLMARVGPTAETVNTVRPSALAHLIDELAGEEVRVSNARVVGVLNPRVFLIESSTPTPAMLGTRDRILVMIGGGAVLRVSPEMMVGASVIVAGIARTLLGVQVSREVSWPSELTREVVDRLEIRAAVLATSIRTADGVELTGEPSAGT